MNVEQLRTFAAVLEHGSFFRAAEALGISQSTVSFQVKALETAAGTILVDRVARRVRPTAAGRLLAGYGKRILAVHDEALRRLSEEESGHGGLITVAASTVPAEYLLPPLLAAFRGTHPGVSVVVEVSDSRRASAALLQGSCDLAVTGLRPKDRRLLSSRFAEDEVILVAAPGLVGRGQLSPEQLRALPLVLREPGSGTREAVARLLPGAPAAGTLQVGSTEAARRCALAGAGLSFVSRCAVEGDLQAGRLRAVAAAGLPVRRTFHVARLRGVTLPAAARAFLRLLASRE